MQPSSQSEWKFSSLSSSGLVSFHSSPLMRFAHSLFNHSYSSGQARPAARHQSTHSEKYQGQVTYTYQCSWPFNNLQPLYYIHFDHCLYLNHYFATFFFFENVCLLLFLKKELVVFCFYNWLLPQVELVALNGHALFPPSFCGNRTRKQKDPSK